MATLNEKTREIAFGCLLLALSNVAAPAQDPATVEVAGVVRDTWGRPLAGVRVERLSGAEATETDEQGAFTLALPVASTLRASRMGYVTLTYPLDPRPTLLYVHGGGWITGSKRDQGRPMLERLAGDGWVCIACNYRLAPRSVWPAQAQALTKAP